MSTEELSGFESEELSHQDPEVLRELYHGKEMSLQDIGDQFGVSASTIRRWMERYGIERRSTSEAMSGLGFGRVERATYYIDQGYPRWYSDNSDGTQDSCRISQLLACIENNPYEVFREDTNVHHKNHHPLDNRLENIEVLTRSKHMVHHRQMEKKVEALGSMQEAKSTRSMPASLTEW